MHNEKFTRSIVLIVILLVLSGLVIWQMTLKQEQTRQEAIQELITQARNQTKAVKTVEFEEAKTIPDYDSVDFDMAVKLFDKLGRDRQPKLDIDNEYNADKPLYAEIIVRGFAVKELSSSKNAAQLQISAELTKNDAIVETKTLVDEVIEVSGEGLVFYEKISDDAEPGDYNIIFTVKDVITDLEVQEELVFTLK